jgi:hypothetical protein
MPNRKVDFFQADSIPNHAPFVLDQALGPINSLAAQQWPLRMPSYSMGLIIDRLPRGGAPARVRLLRLREDERPHVLDPQRRIKAVRIGHNETLTEFTHACWWSDGYVAAAASRDAPAATYLAAYISDKTPQKCTLHRLYDPGVVQRFKAMDKGLRTAEAKIRLRSSEIAQAQADARLRGWSNLLTAGAAAEAVTMTVKFSVDRRRDEELDHSVHDIVGRLAAYDDLVGALVVRGRVNGEVETLDLKKERLQYEMQYPINATDTSIYGLLEQSRSTVESRIGGLSSAARLD